jgi:hypothetical protein
MISLILLITFLMKDGTNKPMKFEKFIGLATLTATADLIGACVVILCYNL